MSRKKRSFPTMIPVDVKGYIRNRNFISSILPLVAKTNTKASSRTNVIYKTWTSMNKTKQRSASPVGPHVIDSGDLHKILSKSHPEVSEIKYILNSSPKMTSQRDNFGKLPLHVACESGASVDVVEVLLSEYESACMIADDDGKLPIHHLCENYVRNSDPALSLDEVADDFLMILELMLQSSSNSLLKLDKNGFSPLEHAIEANLDFDLVYSLQKTTETLLKSRTLFGFKE